MSKASMKKEILAEWLKRLRSGEYKQGVGYLRRTSEGEAQYCCLGVLCEMAVEAGVIKSTQYEGSRVGRTWYDNEIAGLPVKVLDWAGAERISALGSLYDGEADLSTMNDSRTPFPKIADSIEQRIEGV